MHLKKNIKKNKVLLENMSYLTILEVFILIAPLITYPFLVKSLGMEIYGLVITAQALASYASKIIDFGSNRVCAKHVSINREDKNKLSEIVNSVFFVRSFLCIVCFLIYMVIVLIVPIYRTHWLLFLLSYGMTLNEVLFPQYFFQGVEKMKYSSLINIGIKLLFIVLIFIFVNSGKDYNVVPLFYTIGYAVAGVISMYIVYNNMGLTFYLPKKKQMLVYVKDSSAIFATDLICLVKDKLSYFLLGAYSGMSNVVIYDLGLKINTLLAKPVQIISMALFPRSAKSRNIPRLRKVIMFIAGLAIVLVVGTNIFLPWIVQFFIHKQIDLLPLRLFTLAPIFLSISSFVASNVLVAWGYNKYVLYSIIITTATYVLALVVMFFTHQMNSVYAFVVLALISYFAEFIYRMIVGNRVMNNEEKKQYENN